ncbi:myeloid-associated differentiation marker-like [Bos taurus]|uniref:myeloid-associated differentiation marker-like n=1 Tax=Bos taurus TaxID=9913 RepID=UPI000760400E|nr:myeloid-associated differentiation marker-like [Bos taurus]
MPASLLGQKTPTGLPQGPRDPRIPPVISTLSPARPSPGCILRVVSSQGSCRGLLSCIMCVLYAIDMAYMWKRYKLKNIPCYVHTLPGLLKILESAVACVIFVFISNTSLYLHQPALEWCVAVYSICFVQVVVAMLLKLRGWEKRLPLRLPTFHRVGTWFSFLLYVIAMVLWPLYQFNEKLGGQPHWYRDMSCVDELTNYGCVWDQQLAVAILTAINLVIYMADLVYWTRQVSVGLRTSPVYFIPSTKQRWSSQNSIYC